MLGEASAYRQAMTAMSLSPMRDNAANGYTTKPEHSRRRAVEKATKGIKGESGAGGCCSQQMGKELKS